MCALTSVVQDMNSRVVQVYEYTCYALSLAYLNITVTCSSHLVVCVKRIANGLVLLRK